MEGGGITLQGRVLDERGSVPVVGAVVLLDGRSRVAVSDATGAFAFTGLSAGPHLLRVRRLGYLETERSVTLAPGTGAVTVRLVPDPLRLEGVTVSVAPSSLRGLVYDELSGRQVPGAVVRLSERRAVLTDSIGLFDFGEIPSERGLLLVEQFGYESLYVTLPTDFAHPLEIPLRPRPLGVDGITVEAVVANVAAMTRRITNRRNASPSAVRSFDQARLLRARTQDMSDFLRFEAGVGLVPCPRGASQSECVQRRGRPTPLSICIDEHRAHGGLLQLAMYRPSEIYLVEVFNLNQGQQVRVYTRAWMERLGQRRQALLRLEDCFVGVG